VILSGRSLDDDPGDRCEYDRVKKRTVDDDFAPVDYYNAARKSSRPN
jgi:hypothetical protein